MWYSVLQARQPRAPHVHAQKRWKEGELKILLRNLFWWKPLKIHAFELIALEYVLKIKCYLYYKKKPFYC